MKGVINLFCCLALSIAFVCATSSDASSDNSKKTTSTTPSFIGLGDWGGYALGSPYTTNVDAVAAEMVKIKTAYNPDFVINVGDNFYYCGIQNTSDYQIMDDFVKPYASLDLPFYSILGNHEYGYNVSAQLDYASNNENWIMDDRYYSRRIEMTSGSTSAYATFIFLDTSPCYSDYTSSSSSGWDPCGSEYPTCSIGSGDDDDFEGTCYFHQNIMTQNCTAQYEWFVSTLAAVDEDDWLIVVGHHPLDEVDVEDFVAPLLARGFALYMNGHTHSLNQYTINSSGAWITTGAGAMVDTADQTSLLTAMKLLGEDIPAHTKLDSGRVTGSYSYETVFSSKTAGFTFHQFSSDLSSLSTQFISYTGSVLQSFSVNKAGVVTST